MVPYEQKQKYNAQRRYKRLAKKDMANIANREVAALFPRSALTKRSTVAFANSKTDYGGRNAALNFPTTAAPPREKMGTLSIGRCYENRQKETAFGRETCLKSQKHSLFMDKVAESLSIVSDVPQDYLRANMISGAETLPHTDSIRGLVPNYVMFHDPGGAITLKTFPLFRCSVVTLHSRPYIPMGYSEIKGLRMIGHPLNGGSKGAQKFLFPKEALDQLEPYGNLNCAAVGIKDGKVQYLPFEEGYKVYSSPSCLRSTKFSNVICSAEAKRVGCKPRQTVRHLNKINEWQKFYGWKYIHYFSGTDIFARRTHAFFRPIREVPTGANFHSLAAVPNFIKVSLEELKTKAYLQPGIPNVQEKSN